jgi:hypothetical protein
MVRVKRQLIAHRSNLPCFESDRIWDSEPATVGDPPEGLSRARRCSSDRVHTSDARLLRLTVPRLVRRCGSPVGTRNHTPQAQQWWNPGARPVQALDLRRSLGARLSAPTLVPWCGGVCRGRLEE